MIILLLSIYIIDQQLASASKPVTFYATNKVSKSLGPICSEDFGEWFARSETPMTILRLNPGLEDIEEVEPNKYRCALAPIKFPGLSIRSTIDFRTEFNETSFEVICEDDAISQTYEGRKFLAKIVSNLIPTVKSTNKLVFDEAASLLTNEAYLDISFYLPSWFPFPSNAVEDGGSASIQKSLDSDLESLLDKLLYAFWKSNSDATAEDSANIDKVLGLTV